MSKIKFKTLIKSTSLFALYFLIGKLAIKIHFLIGYHPMIWFPSGIGLGLLVVEGESFAPVIFLAAFTLGLSENFPLESSLILGIISTLESFMGARLLKYFSHSPKPRLVSIKEALAFIISVMGVSSLISATLGSGTLYLLGHISQEKFEFTWKVWWFSEAMGDLVIGSAIIYIFNDIKLRLKYYLPKKLEFTCLFILICTTCIFIYTPLSQYNHSLVIRQYFLFPLMIWVIIRFDTLGVVTVNSIVMTTMLVGALQGITPKGYGSLEERIFIQQFVAMALGIMGLVLASAIREKEEALDAKGEFISIASHELKTPITSLKLQYDLSLREFKKQERQSEAEVSFFSKTGRQIVRLTQIVEQLLNTARLEQGTLNLNITKVSPSSLIKNVLDTLSNDLIAARIKTKLNVEEDLIGQWDPFRMEQVLNNIFSNAIKYAPGSPIEVNVTEKNSWANIAIRDHGPGIEPSKADHLFERFVRGADSRKTDGLGLGLFIARQIVVAHGGNINVKSTGGDGTTFEINMPLNASHDKKDR